jgi:F-type H+-transporting ATPase subunit b
MDQTLKQLGELLLGAIPTVILVTLLYGLYKVIVHRPLRRVLEERHSKTEGAIERAKADIAAADASTSEYEQRMREARARLFQAQEAKRLRAFEARANAVSQARNQAQAQVESAKGDIEKDRVAAEKGLQAEAAALAQEIVRRVLEPAGVGL